MAKLIFTDEKFSGQNYELILEKTTVGRANDNTLVIRDPSLSAKHCEILVNGPEVIVRDLGSKNGTYVEGARLHHQQSQVRSGQRIRFGGIEARLELEEADNPSSDTAETAVYQHREIMREQRRAKERPAPPGPARTIQSGSTPSPEEQTILIPRGAVPSQPLPDQADPEPELLEPERSGGKLWLIILALVLGAAALIGLLSRR